MRGWTLEDSTVDPLELPDELKDYARQMVGESAVALTSDRERILLAAAAEVETYCDRAYFRGYAGSARTATSVVEAYAGANVPAIALLPRSNPVNVTHVSRWDDAAEAFQSVTYQARPLGRIRVDLGGVYRIVAAVTPSLVYPTVIDEAVARLFAYRESYKPRARGASDISDGNAPSITGAMMRSGAAECLRHIRTPGT